MPTAFVVGKRVPACPIAARATTLVALELDHVLIAVVDLAEAAREIEARHGLASLEGGRHPSWGTSMCVEMGAGDCLRAPAEHHPLTE
jgi:hypothetical protein